jgi:hypothetical protein
MATTVFYESVEDEEILFQPQGMNVQYVDIEKLKSNLKEAEERKAKAEATVPEKKVEETVPEKKVEETVPEKKVENIIGFKMCPITNRMMKGIKIKSGEWWSEVEPIETRKPTNYEIIMKMCEELR